MVYTSSIFTCKYCSPYCLLSFCSENTIKSIRNTVLSCGMEFSKSHLINPVSSFCVSCNFFVDHLVQRHDRTLYGHGNRCTEDIRFLTEQSLLRIFRMPHAVESTIDPFMVLTNDNSCHNDYALIFSILT